MRRSRSRAPLVGIGLIAGALAVSSGASATSGVVWNDGIVATFAESGVHSADGGGEVKSISCSSPGYCTAVGEFTNVGTFAQAMTMTMTNGAWSPVRPVVFADGVRNQTG